MQYQDYVMWKIFQKLTALLNDNLNQLAVLCYVI